MPLAALTLPPEPPTSSTPRKRPGLISSCEVCGASDHDAKQCAGAATGLHVLLERATKIAEGKRYLVAEAIGISESGLSRATRAGKLSPTLRQRLVQLVMSGALGEDLPPPSRAPGRRPRAAAEAGSIMLYFADEGVKQEFTRLARAHPQGRIGVVAAAVLAYRALHPAPPAPLPGSPGQKLPCRLPKSAVALRAILGDFDTWIGGAAARPRVISIVLAEHCQSASTIELGGTVLALKQGPVEVYHAPRRRLPG